MQGMAPSTLAEALPRWCAAPCFAAGVASRRGYSLARLRERVGERVLRVAATVVSGPVFRPCRGEPGGSLPLPLPLAGEGWGEGGRWRDAAAFALLLYRPWRGEPGLGPAAEFPFLLPGMCQGSCRLRYAACPAEDESRSRFKKTLPIGCQLRVDFDQRSGRRLRA